MNLNNIQFKRIREGGYIFCSKTGDVFSLNETASIIVEGLLDDTLDDSIKKLLDEYDIDEETLHNDIEFIRCELEEICTK